MAIASVSARLVSSCTAGAPWAEAIDSSSREQAPAHSEAARRGRDPHALDLGRVAAVEPQAAAPDQLRPEHGDEEGARRRAEVAGIRRQARAQLEPGAEPLVELGEVSGKAPSRVAVRRIDRHHLHHRRGEEALDLAHGRHQPAALLGAEGLEEGAGQRLAAIFERRSLLGALAGERRPPHPAVGGAAPDADEPVALEGAQQPTEVPRVQVEPRAEGADVAAVLADLPEHPGLAERAVAGQVVVVQRADALGDGPVEAPDLLELLELRIHTSDDSQRCWRQEALVARGGEGALDNGGAGAAPTVGVGGLERLEHVHRDVGHLAPRRRPCPPPSRRRPS